MDLETARYIVNFFPRLLMKNEAAALMHYNTMLKMGTPQRYHSSETYEKRLNWHRERSHITDNPEVLKLLEDGIEKFYLNTATRIQDQTPEKVYFNYCPKCKKLARTPYARQCRHCGHNWHNTVSANFKVNGIFELQTRPHLLFLSGNVVNGAIKEGMTVDLTFLGVAVKARIESINYLDHTAEKKAELTLGIRVESTEDSEYLKKRGALAIPITIEC